MAYWIRANEETLCPKGYVNVRDNEDVKMCVHKIADMVSNMTIMLMENSENGDIRIRDKLARKVDIEPSSIMTRKTFIYRIVADLITHGNAVVIPEIKGEYIDEFRILNAKNCVYRETSDGYRIEYKGTPLNPDDVLHFVCIPDEDQPFRGVGYVPQIKGAIENIAQANATKTGFLRSKWKPSLIISVAADDQFMEDEENRRRILDSYTTGTEAGEPWLIPAGEITVQTVQPLSLKDLAIQDSLVLDKKIVAGAIGVPPFMVGVGSFDRDEFNNFVSTQIFSFTEIIHQEFTKKVLFSPNRYFKFKSRSLLQYNLQELTAHVSDMVGMGMMSRNEGRGEFDYTPVDVDGMNDYCALENYIPVARLGDQKKIGGGEGNGE